MSIYHHRGAASELLAASRFAARGHEVYFPVMTQSAVDFIALMDGEFKRVQVKTGSHPNPKYPHLIQVRLGGSGRQSYTADAFDYLAVVNGERMWVIPTSAVDITQSTICFSMDNVSGRKLKVDVTPFEWRSN